jgi:hypothetical protein
MSGELHAPAAFSLGQNHGARWIGRGMEPRLDLWRREKSLQLPGIEPRFHCCPARSPVTEVAQIPHQETAIVKLPRGICRFWSAHVR